MSPGYFWDEMSLDEIKALYKGRYENDKKDWEQTRTICFYTVVAMHGSKDFKTPEDLFSLTWDKKDEGKKVEVVTKEEALERLKSMRKNKKGK